MYRLVHSRGFRYLYDANNGGAARLNIDITYLMQKFDIGECIDANLGGKFITCCFIGAFRCE